MNTLGMFARHPTPGRTKTRLAATIGADAATRLYATFVEDLISRCRGLADQFIVAATPDDPVTSEWYHIRLRPADLLLFQPAGSLGDRIEWFFLNTIRDEADHAVLIGSDSPDLPSRLVETAFAELSTTDVVIAPANDGGFVLIGMCVPPAELFRDIAWSSASTLKDTLRAARRHNLSVKLLQSWYDIDTVEDLEILHALQQSAESSAEVCPRTAEVLQELWPQILDCR